MISPIKLKTICLFPREQQSTNRKNCQQIKITEGKNCRIKSKKAKLSLNKEAKQRLLTPNQTYKINLKNRHDIRERSNTFNHNSERTRLIFHSPPQKTQKIRIKTTRLLENNHSYDKSNAGVERNQKMLSPDESNAVEQEKKCYPIYFKQTRQSQNTGIALLPGDAVANRYEIISHLSRGSRIRVYQAYDYKNKEEVALKIGSGSEQAKKQAHFLSKTFDSDLNSRCNIVRVKDTFVWRGHCCIVYELLSTNLHEYLKQRKYKPTPEHLMIKFSIQILQCLRLLQQHRIIHGDIQPKNIMLKVKNKSGLRVIDFGGSCFESEQICAGLQSEFYRAPEVILGNKCTVAIDMWSFGCTLAELKTGCPLFSGQSEEQQLLLYMELLGFPPIQMLEASPRRKRFFNDSYQCRIMQSKDHFIMIKGRSFEKALGGHCDRNLIDLVRKCLEWQPQKRITPKQALLHEWIITGIPEALRARHILEVTGEGI